MGTRATVYLFILILSTCTQNIMMSTKNYNLKVIAVALLMAPRCRTFQKDSLPGFVLPDDFGYTILQLQSRYNIESVAAAFLSYATPI